MKKDRLSLSQMVRPKSLNKALAVLKNLPSGFHGEMVNNSKNLKFRLGLKQALLFFKAFLSFFFDFRIFLLQESCFNLKLLTRVSNVAYRVM